MVICRVHLDYLDCLHRALAAHTHTHTLTHHSLTQYARRTRQNGFVAPSSP